MDTITVELAPRATQEVRTLVGELEQLLSAEYLPEQRHGLSLDAIFQPHIKFFLVRSDGIAVGCGGVALFADFAEVKRMYVRDAARGRGVAQSLLARIETEARGAGQTLLRLETGDRQLAAIRFYERSGFQRCEAFGEYASMPPNSIATSVFFEKRLAAMPSSKDHSPHPNPLPEGEGITMEARPVRDDRELKQILDLQRANLARNLSPDEIASQGFVTVEHSFELLQRMHAIRPSIIAKEGEQLAGYALVMPVECRSFIPILAPMFDRIASLGIERQRYYVMGQICVDKRWRGQGIFDLLYLAHRRHLRSAYDCVITEVATRNTRSMRAHERIGFKVIDLYRDSTDEWALIRWNWP